MNIQKINSTNTNITMPIVNKHSNVGISHFGLKMASPITRDTVSFQSRGGKVLAIEARAALARKEARALRDARLIAEARLAPEKTAPTKKNLTGEERKSGISQSTAKQIHDEIQEAQQQIHNFMTRLFSGLKVSELSPKNPILEFSDRAKSAISLGEKAASLDLKSKKEVYSCITDLNGGKIIMNYKTGKPDTEVVLFQLIPLIKTGQVTLHEIELQRPGAIKPGKIKNYFSKEQENFDYVSKKFLDELEDAQEEVLNGSETNLDKIKLINRPLPKYTKGNYCALHLLLQLNEKGSRPFEMQIMGPRVAKGKILDDKRFKFFEGKQVDPTIYEALVNLWKRLLPEENKTSKEELLRYFREACFQLREDELREYETQRIINRPTGLFKTIRDYNLPPEYDLNNQYKIMLNCEAKKTSEVRTSDEAVTKKSAKQQAYKEIKPMAIVNKIIRKINSKQKDSHNKIKH